MGFFEIIYQKNRFFVDSPFFFYLVIGRFYARDIKVV